MSIREVDQNTDIEVSNPYSLTSTIYPLGKFNATSTFTLSVLSINQIAFDFSMTLLSCPPGYHNKHKKCTCASGRSGYASIIKCDDEIFSATYSDDLRMGWIYS